MYADVATFRERLGAFGPEPFVVVNFVQHRQRLAASITVRRPPSAAERLAVCIVVHAAPERAFLVMPLRLDRTETLQNDVDVARER